MAPKSLLFSTILFYHVLTSAGQSALKQYFHVAGIPSSPALTTLPTVGYQRASTAVPSGGLTAVPNNGISSAPNTGITSLGALASLPGLLQALTAAPATPTQQSNSGVPTLKPEPKPTTSSVPTCKQNSLTTNTNGLDPSVLNNLAIALQLLIVSNILNSNLSENEANPIYELLETAKSIPSSISSQNSKKPLHESYQEPNFDAYLPNANFVGNSGFSDGGVIDPYVKPNSRNSFQLMSPYEALGPSSPFSDPILASPYGSVMSSKKDFHSPYVMMDDPFGMNDLF